MRVNNLQSLQIEKERLKLLCNQHEQSIFENAKFLKAKFNPLHWISVSISKQILSNFMPDSRSTNESVSDSEKPTIFPILKSFLLKGMLKYLN